MIRIRTKVGKYRVFTLHHDGLWITLYGRGGKSTVAQSLFEAGQNHLQACLDVQKDLDSTTSRDAD